MARRQKKSKGKKRVNYELINPDSIIGGPVYSLMRDLVDAHHKELVDARIALAWCTSWRPDVDGRCMIGKCKKASDLDRELSQWDFIILLRKSWWYATETTAEKRKALVDHELCHATVRLDDRTNEPVLDERGRKVYRTRKHDWEEFTEVVDRHGIYTRDLEKAAAAILRSARGNFQPCANCRETTNPGWIETFDDNGNSRGLMRCACYVQWAELRREAVAS